MVAPLSYTSKFGYYGLRVNPTFEQVVGTVHKPLRIPLPERKAKWYALGPYRDLLLHTQEKIDAAESSAIKYRATSAELAQSAARDGVGQTDAAADPVFDRIHEHGEAMEAHDAYEAAFDLMNREHRRETQETRREHLRMTHGPNHMHPVLEASHTELRDAGVWHYMPAPRPQPSRTAWRAPPGRYVAYGQPQGREFPDFRTLNMGDPANVRQATLTPSQNTTYERAREFVVGPTWST